MNNSSSNYNDDDNDNNDKNIYLFFNQPKTNLLIREVKCS